MLENTTGFLFIINQQIELDTFLPVAIELKNQNKNFDIRFFIINDEFDSIKKSSTLNNLLKKFQYSFKVKKFKNNFFQLISYNIEKIKIYLWLKRKKKSIVFFPSLAWSDNKSINFFLKKFKSKKIFLFKNRQVDDEVIVKSKSIRKMYVPKNTLNFFDYFIYYHNLQIDYLNKIKQILSKNTLSKLVKIGLPRLFPSWKKIIQIESKKELYNIRKKFKNFTNIYSIIGITSFDLTTIKSTKKEYFNNISNLLEIIKKIDPKSIILYKPHPRDKNIQLIFEKFKDIIFNRFDFTYMHADVLSLISKRIFFIKPNNILTNIIKSFKIDYTDYSKFKENKDFFDYSKFKENKDFFIGKGYGVIKFDPNKISKKKLLNLFDDSYCLKNNKNLFIQENKLIAQNPPKINKLINLIN